MKREVGHGPTEGTAHIKIKEPHSYDGVRSEKTLGNVLLDMEQYLECLGLPNEEAKVNVVSQFVTKDAKRWWMRK